MTETLRAKLDEFYTFGLEVIFEQRRGKGAAVFRSFLYLLSKLVQLDVKIHRFLIQARILRDTTLGIQVIAIGNLTVGGTGKTPVVEKFARELQKQGRTVAILSRGYRSRPQPLAQWLLNNVLFRADSTPPRVVSDGKSLLLDSDTAGDEPYMLASNLKDVVVLVDKNRVKSGRYAIENFGCDTLLLDDGFQYWRLAGRRQDVVLIDCQQPFGNERLLPRGTLREPHSHLARASTIFITKSDGNTGRAAPAHRPLQSHRRHHRVHSSPPLLRGCFHRRTKGPGFHDGQTRRLAQRHRPAGELRAKPDPSCAANWFIPSASPTTTVSPSRKSSTSSTAARNARPRSSSPPKRTPSVSPKLTAAICRFISCAWK